MNRIRENRAGSVSKFIFIDPNTAWLINPSMSLQVELRHRQTVYGRNTTGGVCLNGNCGTETEHAGVMTAKHSGNFTWRQYEVTTTRKLKTNLPFEMR